MNLSQDDIAHLRIYFNQRFDSLYKKIDSLSEGIKSFKSPLGQNLLKPNLSVNENLGELISPTSSITFKKGVGEINSPKTSLNDSSIQINSFDGSNTENLSPKFQINSINGSEFMDTPKP
jgi:hypothetical protein